ncbi:hypothetical protein [Vibrio phage RYC]|nr:hypothetical protein [Vibrio phage RYC]
MSFETATNTIKSLPDYCPCTNEGAVLTEKEQHYKLNSKRRVWFSNDKGLRCKYVSSIERGDSVKIVRLFNVNPEEANSLLDKISKQYKVFQDTLSMYETQDKHGNITEYQQWLTEKEELEIVYDRKLKSFSITIEFA